MLVARAALLLCILPAVHAFRCAVGHSRPWHAPLDAVMRASYAEGPFKVPDPPANFDGAQWAPHVFKPFPIHVADVRPAAEEIKEVLKEEAAAAAPVAEAAPPAEAPAPAADANAFMVTMKTPDGDLSVAYDKGSDLFLLDYLDETENADDYADLPYACRAGSCSACAAKLVSGTMDTSACSFLSDEQKADGWVLSCTARPTSDVVLEMHKEDDMY